MTPWSAKKAAYEQRSCSDNGNGEFVLQNLLETAYDHLIRFLCGRANPRGSIVELTPPSWTCPVGLSVEQETEEWEGHRRWSRVGI